MTTAYRNPIRRHHLRAVRAALLAALLAAGSAHAQLTSISLTTLRNSSTLCSGVEIGFDASGNCSSTTPTNPYARCTTTGTATIEVSQGSNSGSYSLGALEYPASGAFNPLALALPGALGAPFTVTLTVTDDGTTYSTTRHLSGCTNPQFESDLYTVRGYAANLSGGSVSCSTVPVAPGGTSTCTVTPDSGYEFKYLELDSGTLGDISCQQAPTINPSFTCTLRNITSNVIVRGMFILPGQFTVTGVADPPQGGTVLCTSPVEYDGSATCTWNANEGYTQQDVPSASDGVMSCNARMKSCTLNNVRRNAGLTVPFKMNSYTVTVAVDPPEGGQVLSRSHEAFHGSSAFYEFIPHWGYTHIGVEVEPAANASPVSCTTYRCIVQDVKGNITLTSKFRLNEYAVTGAADPPEGGTASCTSPVPHGSGTTCRFTANEGYSFAGASHAPAIRASMDDCPGGLCTLSNVKDAVTVTATFKDSGGGGGGGAVTGTASPVPTLGEVGLLLSGIALAGAAAPALRRRERNEREQRKRA